MLPSQHETEQTVPVSIVTESEPQTGRQKTRALTEAVLDDVCKIIEPYIPKKTDPDTGEVTTDLYRVTLVGCEITNKVLDHIIPLIKK